MTSFLGVPLLIWAAACLMFALLYYFVYPTSKVKQAKGFRYVALRYFHSLVWVMLMLACLIRGFTPLVLFSSLLAIIALPIYGIFIWAFASTPEGTSSP